MGRPRLFDLNGAVTSALNVFWERGYGATTPAELLEAIGVGKGSFYNAFESKHSLFAQALRRYGDDRVAGLLRWFAADVGPVGERIKAYLERLAAPENEKALRRGCFAANTAAELGDRDPVATKIVRGTFERMESVLEAALVEGQKRGELDGALEPKAIASLLLAALVGITVLAKVDGSTARTKRIALALAALL